MLDLVAQPEEGLRAGQLDDAHILVGQAEIVGRGIVGIGVEIREDGDDVDGMLAAVGGIERRVVRAGVGDAGFLIGGQVGDALIGGELVHRAVVDGVHGLDRAELLGKIDNDMIHKGKAPLHIYTAPYAERGLPANRAIRARAVAHHGQSALGGGEHGDVHRYGERGLIAQRPV